MYKDRERERKKHLCGDIYEQGEGVLRGGSEDERGKAMNKSEEISSPVTNGGEELRRRRFRGLYTFKTSIEVDRRVSWRSRKSKGTVLVVATFRWETSGRHFGSFGSSLAFEVTLERSETTC